MSLDEVIGSLIIHELQLEERESHEEEQVLVAKALSKAKISTAEESSLCGRGRHRGRGRRRRRGRGRGCNQPLEEDKESNSFDQLAIQCYNFQKYGHLVYECRSAKKARDDQAYVAEATPVSAVATFSRPAMASSSLLMAIVEEPSDLLLHESESVLYDPTLWYLDTGVTNHMSGH